MFLENDKRKFYIEATTTKQSPTKIKKKNNSRREMNKQCENEKVEKDIQWSPLNFNTSIINHRPLHKQFIRGNICLFEAERTSQILYFHNSKYLVHSTHIDIIFIRIYKQIKMREEKQKTKC